MTSIRSTPTPKRSVRRAGKADRLLEADDAIRSRLARVGFLDSQDHHTDSLTQFDVDSSRRIREER